MPLNLWRDMSQKYDVILHTVCKQAARKPSRDRVFFKKKNTGCLTVWSSDGRLLPPFSWTHNTPAVRQNTPARPAWFWLSPADRYLSQGWQNARVLVPLSFSSPPREPSTVYIRERTRCVMASQVRTYVIGRAPRELSSAYLMWQ